MPRVPRPADPPLRHLLLIACLFAAGGCAGPALREAPPASPPAPEPEAPPGDAGPEVYGPEVLALPEAADEVIARVGGRELRKAQLYDYLLRSDRVFGLQVVCSLVAETLAAEVARREGVRVPRAEVERHLARRLEQDERDAGRRLGPEAGLEEWAEQLHGISLAQYRKEVRQLAARQLLTWYVVTFRLLAEDQVRGRMMALASRAEAERLAAACRQGADFAVLARKHSLDPTAARGGRIPPFFRDHPVVGQAFALAPGQVSDPIPGRLGDRPAWFLVFVEEHVAGRREPFARLADEVAQRVRTAPPGQEEILSFLGTEAERLGLRLPLPGTTREPHGDGPHGAPGTGGGEADPGAGPRG